METKRPPRPATGCAARDAMVPEMPEDGAAVSERRHAMKYDLPLILLSLFAGITTFLVISVNVFWIALTVALRKKGCRVTLLHHDWRKVEQAIATVQSPAERKKYEQWEKFLRYTYLAWGMAMLFFVLLILFVYN